MLMLLIACIFRGFCFSLSICPWRETQELVPICPLPPLLFCLQPPPPSLLKEPIKFYSTHYVPSKVRSFILRVMTTCPDSNVLSETELERRMKGPGELPGGAALGAGAGGGGEGVKEEPRPLRAIPFPVGRQAKSWC